ncbi:MAG: amino acid adenylation domain-containing protein [Alphaproteobacteria bacterium]|nr:amino acid adenylation domain-containing protein [Alphaproteobacteria bacterium]
MESNQKGSIVQKNGTSSKKKLIFSCVVISETNLGLKCAESIVKKGHKIVGIVSQHEATVNWALDNNIVTYQSIKDPLLLDLYEKFDYLFSIVNNEMLSDTILSLPKLCAINFHDGPLPRYAGIHSTSWALLNNEKSHGVTWHIMESKPDSGPILRQTIFPISADATALSLNFECFNHGLLEFEKLIEKLSPAKIPEGILQDVSQRTYFAKLQKPKNLGFVDWYDSAETISRQFKALFFGDYPNNFVSFKVALDDNIITFSDVRILPTKSHTKPGTVVDVTDNKVIITSVTNDLEFINPKSLYFNLKINFYECLELPHLSASILQNLKKHVDSVAHLESFWVRELAKAQYHHLPFVSNVPSTKHNYKKFIKSYAEYKVSDEGPIAALIIYLWFITNNNVFTVNVLSGDTYNKYKDCSLFSDLLPLNCKVSGAMSVAALMSYIHKKLLNMQSNKTFLRDVFVRFPVLMSVQSESQVTIILSPDAQINNRSESLFFHLDNHNKSYTISIRQDCDNPDSAKANYLEDLPEHIENLIEQISLNDQISIGRLSLISKKSQEKIIKQWNDTEKKVFLKDNNIIGLFESMARNRPNVLAVICDDTHLTYQALNERVNQLAHHLINLGVTSETIVGVFFERSIEMVISLLAILKTGGAYLPLNPDDPISRINYMLADSQSQLLIVQSHLAPKMESAQFCSNIQILNLDETYLNSAKQTNPVTTITRNNIVYVIYTSGSTGKPKGVMVEHGSLSNRLQWMRSHYNITSEDKILQKTPYGFDVSVWEIFCPLISGAALVIIPSNMHKDVQYLINHIKKHNISIVHFVPSMLKIFLEHVGKDERFPLRLVIVSGETLLNSVKEEYYQKLSAPLENLYGPTEATIDVTYFSTLSEEYATNNKTVPIGKPITNTQMYILNSNLIPVDENIPGEIYIGGDGVARGYIRNPALTATTFIANPFSHNSTNPRIYKTGDLAYYSPEGIIVYLGRNDSQVKIAGNRIELTEIEKILNSYSGIKQSVVLVKDLTEYNNSKSLIAFYEAEEHFDEEILLDYLKFKLPNYMIPNTLIHIMHFPITTNGKIDRSKLLDYKYITRNDNYSAPRNEVETKMCNILSELLNIDVKYVGIKDNFLKLGGDSITAIRFVGRLRQIYGIFLNVNDIFHYKSIENICANLLASSYDRGKEIQVENGILSGEVELLPIQNWFFDHKFTHANHWNQSFLIKTPELNVEKLKKCLIKLLRYHNSFSLKFDTKNRITQFYDANSHFTELKTLDIRSLKSKEGTSEFDVELNAILTSWQDFFDLKKGPLYSVGYICGYRDNSSRIFFGIHHLIVDVISWRIITEDLERLYNEQELSYQSSSYRQWSNCLKNYTITAQERDYWNHLRAEMSSNTVSLECSDILIECNFELEENHTQKILSVSNVLFNTQINDLLLAALANSLAIITSQETNFIVLEGHGREQISSQLDVTRTIGWFTTLFPVCLKGNNNLTKLIIDIKDYLRQIPNKGIGYGILHGYELQKLPKISFNYLGQFNHSKHSHHINNNWEIVDEKSGDTSSKSNRDNNIVNIVGILIEGKIKFKISAYLGSNLLLKFCKQFKENLLNVIDFTLKQKRTILTSSDVDYIIEQDDLDKLQAQHEIQNIYLANSLQQGFIYHFLNNANHLNGSYTVQLAWKYNVALDLKCLKVAWQVAQKRFGCLRLRFSWTTNLLQIIDKSQFLDWRFIDIQNESSIDSQECIIAEIKEKDRKELYKIDKGSLFRVYIIQQKEDLYTCIFSHHHSILDGWSNPILYEYIHQVYLHMKKSESFDISQDYIYEETQRYLQQKSNQHNDYWAEYFDQINNEINHRALMAISGCSKYFEISKYQHLVQQNELRIIINDVIYNKLQEIGYREGVTLSTIVEYLWHKLLSIYGNESLTIVGTIVSGRNLPINNIDKGVGLFANTLPIIVNHNKLNNCTIIQAIKSLQLDINQINSKTETNLVNLQKGRERLFDTLFMYGNYPNPANNYHRSELQISFLEGIERQEYPLGIIAYEDNTNLIIKFRYAGELFSDNRINDISVMLQDLLEQVAINPYKDIRLLSHSNESSRNIKKIHNSILKAELKSETFVSIFEEQVEKTPNNIALILNEEYLSYFQLNTNVNQLSYYLSGLGVGTESVVAIIFDRSIEMMVSILAILKAGGAYLPIDPLYPAERIQYMLEDSGTSIILTSSRCIDIVPPTFAYVISLDEIKNEVQLLPTVNPAFKIYPENLAYIIYTSGTTGRPKGVMCSHSGIVNLKNDLTKKYRLKQNGEVILQFSNYVFDASIEQFALSLLNGHTLLLLPEDLSLDRESFYKYLTFYKVSHIHATPSFLLQFDFNEIKSLSRLVFGGEELMNLSNIILPSLCELINEYGPTETTITATTNVGFTPSQSISIGKPIENTTIYLLERNLNKVPKGAIGEIYIGGAGVTRGYLNNPSLTAEVFIANPFYSKELDNSANSTRLYRTGDLGRFLEDGTIEFIGRIDAQVKVRGYRIELGEIEAAILDNSGIQQCVVVLREKPSCIDNPYTTKFLVAYYVASIPLDQNTILNQLQNKIPHYMLPDMLIRLEFLPLTRNGKIDKNALPEIGLAEDVSNYVAPRNDIEDRITIIWSEILVVPKDKISIYDDFFALGGDSITAIRLSSRMYQEFSLDITVRHIFEFSTIEKLYELLSIKSINVPDNNKEWVF